MKTAIGVEDDVAEVCARLYAQEVEHTYLMAEACAQAIERCHLNPIENNLRSLRTLACIFCAMSQKRALIALEHDDNDFAMSSAILSDCHDQMMAVLAEHDHDVDGCC